MKTSNLRMSVQTHMSVHVQTFNSGSVHSHRPNLADTLAAWQFTRVGLDYDLVAVFGSQSTGKSTPAVVAAPRTRTASPLTGSAPC